MTLEILVIGAIRVAGSLPVLRWPLAGGILAVLVDLSDLLLRDVLDLGGLGDYQAFDKWVDQVYLGLFLVVALRWSGVERGVAVALYGWRLIGFVAFELTGDRGILLWFPNVFEFWFLLVAGIHRFRPGFTWRPVSLVAALAVLLGLKELHEWSLHGARLFDGISSLEFLELVGQWLRSVTGS
ncbi:MAG TPA: hypothetical protein VFR14_13380 [Candidatus Limnocylindrales bacterium]|nr:hypothetical protein [Candidatus Limnocylindrales bacterium]